MQGRRKDSRGFQSRRRVDFAFGACASRRMLRYLREITGDGGYIPGENGVRERPEDDAKVEHSLNGVWLGFQLLP
jgi:hypothetical protein